MADKKVNFQTPELFKSLTNKRECEKVDWLTDWGY